MASVRKLPELEVLRRLAEDENLTNRQIAERFGVSPEAVRQAFAKEGIRNAPARPSHARYLPWRIRADHASDVIARRLRAYSKREQGLELSPTENRLLDEWLAFMDGGNSYGLPLSVHYNRLDDEGFWLEPRVAGDRDYIHPPAA